MLLPLDQVRRELEETAVSAAEPQKRALLLRRMRDDLDGVVGYADSLLREIDYETGTRAPDTNAQLVRENADLREELLRRGLADEEWLDEYGFVSHESLDEAAEEGRLQEAIAGALAKFIEKLHPRDRGGKFAEKPGGAKLRKLVGRDGKTGDSGAKPPKVDRLRLADWANDGPETPGSVPEGMGRRQARAERNRSVNVGKDPHGPLSTPEQDAERTAKDATKRRTALDKRVSRQERRASRDIGRDSKLRADAAKREEPVAPYEGEPHFNAAGKVSQRTLLDYVNGALSTPSTTDDHSTLNADGTRTWDESRAELHDKIIDMLLRQRHEDGAISPLNPYLPSQESPSVLFMGGGYAPLALDTRVPTPSGWTTIGQVKPGDYVFSASGRPVLVEGVSEVFTGRDCFELEFDDGERIVADAEHRWVTSTIRSRRAERRGAQPEMAAAMGRARAARAGGATLEAAGALAGVSVDAAWRWTTGKAHRLGDAVVTTREIAESVREQRGGLSQANHAIRCVPALDLPEALLPIEPYTLGLWLGDGDSHQGNITSADPEALDQIVARGYDVKHLGGLRYRVHGLTTRLRALSLLSNKHVPDRYLRASAQQRRLLLAGLMDSDGHADANGRCEFTNTRRGLADAVAELAVSLGCKARVTEGRAMLNGRDVGPKYRVHFTPAEPPFLLARKRARCAEWASRPQRARLGARFITAVREVASVPTRCLAVADDEHRFLVGESMVATCNSGKSSTQKILAARGDVPEDALKIDPDQIKAMLPEFAYTATHDPEANLRVYQEAWEVAQRLQVEGQQRKMNVIVDGITNTSPDEVFDRVQGFKDQGYGSARITYVDIPTEEALKRSAARAVRARERGDGPNMRHIPESIMRAVHRDVAATAPALMGDQRAKDLDLKMEVWDNSGDGAPVRLADFDGSALNVENRGGWERFQNKAHENIAAVGETGPTLPEEIVSKLEDAQANGLNDWPKPSDTPVPGGTASGTIFKDLLDRGLKGQDVGTHNLHGDGQGSFNRDRILQVHNPIIQEAFSRKDKDTGEMVPLVEFDYDEQGGISGVRPLVDLDDPPVMLFMMGGSASGKSSALEQAGGDVEPPNAVTIDPDHYKTQLPEYEQMMGERKPVKLPDGKTIQVPKAPDKYGAAGVHEESSILAKRIQALAEQARMNVVVDGTGNSPAKIDERDGLSKFSRKVKAAADGGFAVDVFGVNAPTNVAVIDATNRARQTGRWVPEPEIRNIHRNVSANVPLVEGLAQQGLIRKMQFWDRSGGPMVKIADMGEDGTIVPSDPVSWDAFLAKADEDPTPEWGAAAARRAAAGQVS